MAYYESHNKPLPRWYLDEPVLLPGDEFYMVAFSALSTCRHFGQMVGPIPWDRIIDYGCRKRLNSGMLDVFEVVIRQLDEMYLKQLRDDQRVNQAAK